MCALVFGVEVILRVCVKCADKGSEGQCVAFSFRGQGIVCAAHSLLWKNQYKTGSR